MTMSGTGGTYLSVDNRSTGMHMADEGLWVTAGSPWLLTGQLFASADEHIALPSRQGIHNR